MSGIERLLNIMERLRDPEKGCPWDLEQSFETISPYTIEEAYEVDDAARRGDFEALRGELGDLLLQVVFHAQMAREAGHFDFADVHDEICDKLVVRHPHVFADAANAAGAEVATAADQTEAWEAQKAREREAAGANSVLDGVPLSMPALLRSRKLLSRAARAGFAWPDAEAAARKVTEELEEVRAEIDAGDAERLEAEVGDLLIAAAALAQRLDVDPEKALRGALARFEGRLRGVERGLAEQGRRLADAEHGELMERWERAKSEEVAGG